MTTANTTPTRADLCMELSAMLGSHEAGQFAAFTMTAMGLLLDRLHQKDLIDANQILRHLAPTPNREEALPVWCKAFELLVVSGGGDPHAKATS